jgi:hypothetical protein
MPGWRVDLNTIGAHKRASRLLMGVTMQGIDSRLVLAAITEVTRRLEDRQPLDAEQWAIANSLTGASITLTKIGIRSAREAQPGEGSWIASARREGWVEGEGDALRLTPAGRAAARAAREDWLGEDCRGAELGEGS